MNLMLTPDQGFVKDGKFDLDHALIDVGVKAAICYKEVPNNEEVTPQTVRDSESKQVLLKRGLNTILNDHTTPSEHQVVSLEISGISKSLCMVLNNEHQYTSDERSLRYTEVEENDSITHNEVELYRKWVSIFEDIITKKYWEFYRKFTKTDAGAKKTIHKLALENARYLVTVFMKTTTTYTVPFIQINKIASYMQEVINNPLDDYEARLVPEMKEFIQKLEELDVLLTKEKLFNLVTKEEYKDNVASTIKNLDSYKDNKELVYQNNKYISLSLFAKRNKFSVIDYESIFTHGMLNYNNCESLACLAQEQRHRTIDCEMKIPQEQQIYVPEIIKNDLGLTSLWVENAKTVFDRYPQGMLVKVNRQATAKNILDFVAKERSCERAQLEIYKHYYEDIIPFMYDEALSNNEEEMASIIKPYVRKLKCQYPDYNCPTSCGHPRKTRNL